MHRQPTSDLPSRYDTTRETIPLAVGGNVTIVCKERNTDRSLGAAARETAREVLNEETYQK